ncbi:hypothetical protein VP01_2670g6 [Puccinia sorghi]|uniref:Peroxin-7 n=1 Tax=Puccinia sorghi TaxID=27349 RepID=A0A0L6V5Q9_9BASI|nr:hypothetical protein VP01_2670g6 [Puccinia sorghi]
MNSKLQRQSSIPGFAGYSCAYSPFYPNRLAIASAANFGLVGNGRLHILTTDAHSLSTEKTFDSQDALYDLAWSEIHENQLVTGSGDGSIKLWDIMLNELPVQSWLEHTREVFCLDWNNLNKLCFASSSWDHLVKIWTPSRSESIMTIPAHDSCVYAARFSPSSADTLATCSSDGTLKTWDTRTKPTSRASLVIAAHPNEVLSLDWNKYATHYVATASVDRTVKIHDLRHATTTSLNSNACVETLLGHQYAIRNVAWSPHAADQLASCGYDMTARVWAVPQIAPKLPHPHPAALIGIHHLHKEFVFGLAWSLFQPGLLATASWDQQVHLWSL